MLFLWDDYTTMVEVLLRIPKRFRSICRRERKLSSFFR